MPTRNTRFKSIINARLEELHVSAKYRAQSAVPAYAVWAVTRAYGLKDRTEPSPALRATSCNGPRGRDREPRQQQLTGYALAFASYEAMYGILIRPTPRSVRDARAVLCSQERHSLHSFLVARRPAS